MNNATAMNPYAGNPLVDGLGPILSPKQLLGALAHLPPKPHAVQDAPVHIRLHHLMGLRDLHIPSHEGLRLHGSIDLMVRQGYRYRDPLSASTWGLISGEPTLRHVTRAPAMAAVVVGHSGAGKTEAILRNLEIYPTQTVCHETFPRMAGPFKQVVWMSADVPASGRSTDLAANLMMVWHRVTQGERFKASLDKERRDGAKMLDEWRQVAISHFLGILHLDEVQNFFKLQSLERRRKQKDDLSGLELSLVEDACLKWILTLTNTWQIPLLLSGTPDGVGALTKRLSTAQRFVTSGYHVMKHFETASDENFRRVLFPALCQYQYVKKPLPETDALAALVIELTAGIPRLIIALWIAAHRVAFERKADDLRVEDFKIAANSYLSLVTPAVEALRSGDPKRMRRYEDLMPRDDGYWAKFWESAVAF